MVSGYRLKCEVEMASANMADEWEENDSVGKSLAHADIKEKCEKASTESVKPEKKQSNGVENSSAGDRNDASMKSDRGNRGRGLRGRGRGGGGGNPNAFKSDNPDAGSEKNENVDKKQRKSSGSDNKSRDSDGKHKNYNNSDRNKSDNSNRKYDRDDHREGGGHRGRGGGGSHNRGNPSGGRGGGNRHQNHHHKKADGEKNAEYIPPAPTEDENEIFTSGITIGTNFDKYNEIPVNVTGEDAPAVIDSFENSGLSEFVLMNIDKSNYKVPTPIQKAAIPAILAGRDLMACAQTGSGKSAAFLLPIINRIQSENRELVIGKPQAIVITPTRELGTQIWQETKKFSTKSSLKTCIVYGGASAGYQSDHLERGCHILVATPGRLLDFVDKGIVSFDDIRIVVLDEADRMLDMGFLPSIEKMMKHSTMPSHDKRQTLMFSATFPEDIQRLAGQFLNRYIFIAVGVIGGACADVEQKIYEVSRFDKRKKLTEILMAGDPEGTMIFVEQKRNADFLASYLSETKISTTSIHGDRLQKEREEALGDFKSGRMKLLIATSVAARGLDIKNAKHVINFDLPKSIDEYVHRIGRTGRVGNCGRATSFFDPEEDMAIAADLKKILSQANQVVPEFLQDLKIASYNTSASGSGGGKSGHFGGKDFRKGMRNSNNKKPLAEAALPQPNEPEENW